MATSTINSDMRVNGHFSSQTMSIPNSTITNAAVASNAAIAATKLQHTHKAGTHFGLEIDDTPSAAEFIVFVCSNPNGATVRAFRAMLNDTGTTTDVAFDLKKNGSSILSAVVTITHSQSDREVLDGTLSSTALAEGDVLSISLAVTSSTGAQGPYAWVEVDEVAA